MTHFFSHITSLRSSVNPEGASSFENVRERRAPAAPHPPSMKLSIQMLALATVAQAARIVRSTSLLLQGQLTKTCLVPLRYLPKIAGTPDWQVVRTAANHFSNGPVTDVTSKPSGAIRRLRVVAEARQTTRSKPAEHFTGQLGPNIFHPGAMSAYMAKSSAPGRQPPTLMDRAAYGSRSIKIVRFRRLGREV